MDLLEKRQYIIENKGNLPEKELELFKQNFACVFTRNSACIEGNSITLEQVVSITKGYNVKCDGNFARCVFNHYKAYQMVVDHASKKLELTEDFFKDVHEQLMDGIIAGGLYRNVDIRVNGSKHTPCSYIKVYDRMNKFFYDINNYTGSVVEQAAYAHLQIAKVHPFLDGNGRMARLMMNYVLIANGYFPVSIPMKRREEYFNCLEEFKVNKTMKPFLDLLEELLNKEYDRIIELINRYK